MTSLRQKQIDEILNYHRDMNQAVFNRNVRSVAASEQSRSAPRKTDLEVEYEIRKRVEDMKSSIQSIIQQFSYLSPNVRSKVQLEAMSGYKPAELKEMRGEVKDDEEFAEFADLGDMGSMAPSEDVEPSVRSLPRVDRETEISIAKSSSKLEDVLTSLISNWNSLVIYYDAKNRQKQFTGSEENALVGIIKELESSLKDMLGNIIPFKSNLPELYTKAYNVTFNLLKNISAAPPLQKLPISMLTDKVAILPDLEPENQLNDDIIQHFNELYDRMNIKDHAISRIVPSSRIEVEAKERALKDLDVQYNKIKSVQNKAEASISQLKSDYDKYFKDRTNPTSRYRMVETREKLKTLEKKLQPQINKFQNLIDKIEGNIKRRTTEERYDPTVYLEEEEDVLAPEPPGAGSLTWAWIKRSPEYENYMANRNQMTYNKLHRYIMDESRQPEAHLARLPEHFELYGKEYSKESDKEEEDEEEQDSVGLADEGVYGAFADEIEHELTKLSPKVSTIANIKKRIRNSQRLNRTEKDKLLNLFRREGYGKSAGAHYPNGTDAFGDESLLAPYLTQRLKPSKFHQNIKEDVSSSDESTGSSGSDEEGGKKPTRKSKRMAQEQKKELPKQGKEGMILIEKIMTKSRGPRNSGGKKPGKKAAMEYDDKKDLWFL